MCVVCILGEFNKCARLLGVSDRIVSSVQTELEIGDLPSPCRKVREPCGLTWLRQQVQSCVDLER